MSGAAITSGRLKQNLITIMRAIISPIAYTSESPSLTLTTYVSYLSLSFYSRLERNSRFLFNFDIASLIYCCEPEIWIKHKYRNNVDYIRIIKKVFVCEAEFEFTLLYIEMLLKFHNQILMGKIINLVVI